LQRDSYLYLNTIETQPQPCGWTRKVVHIEYLFDILGVEIRGLALSEHNIAALEHLLDLLILH
jgi:hypothetical protein